MSLFTLRENADKRFFRDWTDIIGEIAFDYPAQEPRLIFSDIFERSARIFAEIHNDFTVTPFETAVAVNGIRVGNSWKSRKFLNGARQFRVAGELTKQDFKSRGSICGGSVSAFKIFPAEKFISCRQGTGIKFAENVVGIDDFAFRCLQIKTDPFEFIFQTSVFSFKPDTIFAGLKLRG